MGIGSAGRVAEGHQAADGAAGRACHSEPGPARPRPGRGYASGKRDYLSRLRKIEGRVRGLQKMIDADTWCPDVVTQVASVTRALQEVAVGLLTDHVRRCVREQDAGLDEVAGAIRRMVRL